MSSIPIRVASAVQKYAALFLLMLAVTSVGRGQALSPYDLRVVPERGLIKLQLTTNEGKVNVYLPDGVREGQPFSGAAEILGTVSSSATAADETPLRFAAQRAAYTDRKELVPYLCLHFHDQGWFFGDYGVSPASDAVNAINALEHRPIPAGEMEALCKAETGNFPTAVH
jgi:hypothetical protein